MMHKQFERIGIIGVGSMGSCMTMLFAKHGLQVSAYDVKDENVDNLRPLLEDGLAKDLHSRVTGFKDLDEFMLSFDTCKSESKDADISKLLLFSLPHGSAADSVLEAVRRHLAEGDIILDGGNEWYENAERRQRALAQRGVAYISLGVSGGYQSARRGPSMSASGDKAALDRVMPLLEKVAAKARDRKTGEPVVACAAGLGPGGCGHYVKMAHNGIEQGMLGIVCEAWEMMHRCLGMELDEISEVWKRWEEEGELKRNFLIGIGADICGRHKEGGKGHVVDEVQDKVVQDADDTEGTGTWCVMEAAKRHVSAPSIAAAHFFRIASADRAERMKVVKTLGESVGVARKQAVDDRLKAAFLEELRLGMYCGFLASFAQGLNLIARASAEEGWEVDLGRCVQIWREGCIIRSEYIADVLQGALEEDRGVRNVLTLGRVGAELGRTVGELGNVVRRGVEWNAHIPTLSASYEYVKYCAGKELASEFMEAELDYFGAHSYDEKGEGAGEVKKGKHHYEWKRA